MSLFLEMFLLLILSGLLGMLIGWMLHGKCNYEDKAGGL
jgi:hypothetical protein